MIDFNPNAAATKDSGIFGLPFSIPEAKLVLIPVPWEVTTSYGGGTSLGPQAIFDASKQVDLFDLNLGNFFNAGIAMTEFPHHIQQWNDEAKKIASIIIDAGGALDDYLISLANKVNAYSTKLNNYVYEETKRWLSEDKIVGIIGGDHSTPFGAIQAHLEKYPHMGILHFDAHADLRDTYEGFEYSHASIMHNVISKTTLEKLVQVGIRDFCEEEYDFILAHPSRIKTFFDANLFEEKSSGRCWSNICDEIIAELPKEVYISFDIDGLDPRFCPNTGTPVPGGLDFQEAILLIKKVAHSGRKIIGFDLNEVSPGNSESEWDANVGARLLYKLCGYSLNKV